MRDYALLETPAAGLGVAGFRWKDDFRAAGCWGPLLGLFLIGTGSAGVIGIGDMSGSGDDVEIAIAFIVLGLLVLVGGLQIFRDP